MTWTQLATSSSAKTVLNPVTVEMEGDQGIGISARTTCSISAYAVEDNVLLRTHTALRLIRSGTIRSLLWIKRSTGIIGEASDVTFVLRLSSTIR